jgi:hypothetical protein
MDFLMLHTSEEGYDGMNMYLLSTDKCPQNIYKEMSCKGTI